MSDKLSEYYCEYCHEQYVEEFDGEYTFIQIDIRPYDLFCCSGCVEAHINDIENGEWSHHDGGLENYYKDEIKNRWKNFPYSVVSADNLQLIKHGNFPMNWGYTKIWNEETNKYEEVSDESI